MQDDIRANLMRDLYKQIPKATNKDLASAIEYLKSAIEIRSGKSQNRSELIEEQAEKEGIRGTAWVRKVAYKELERIYPSTTYKVAEAKDELMWRESVERRIQGRKSKQ